MKHFASPDFWRKYHLLPQTIRDLADRHFRLMKADPRHPSLRLKRAGEFWSVRILLGYRALGKQGKEGMWLRHRNRDGAPVLG